MGLLRLTCWIAGLFGAAALIEAWTAPAIHFSGRLLAFRLENCETAARHAPETMIGGVAVLDYDRDGNLDLFFANGADIDTLKKTSPKYWNRLYRGNGDGTFSDVTEKAGLGGVGYDTGVAVGDYDNDGFPDIFVAGVHRNTLYHNNGDGTFSDVTTRALPGRPDPEYGPLWSVGAAWVDVNNDGLLDLFVVNYLSWDALHEPKCDYRGQADYCHHRLYKELPNQLFLNQGDGTFLDVSAASGIRAHPGKGMAVGVMDYDGDGLPDLFVTNDKLFNSLFHNMGNGKFEEVAFEAGVALPENGSLISGMGVDCRDVDNDGWPDIAVVALNNETFPLYLNTGKRGFREVTAQTGLTRLSAPMAGYSPIFADFDNDGWKDLFVSRGHVQSLAMNGELPIDQPNTVFRNTGVGARDGMWTAQTGEAGFAALPQRRHRGAAVGDFNHDGKLDLVVTALGAPAELWLNDTPGVSHWLELALTGTRSNRDAAGARIRLTSASGTQYQYVSAASGYASSSAGPIHFGLGADKAAQRIEIRWPSGKVQELRDVAADRVVKVLEPR